MTPHRRFAMNAWARTSAVRGERVRNPRWIPAKGERKATRRHYLMCPPTYFTVAYAINPWMRPDDPAGAVDPNRVSQQWEALRRVYTTLGHQVSVIDPVPELPDMVFAANGALVVDGMVFGAKFRYAERAPEATHYLEWFKAHAAELGLRSIHVPVAVNEGEGDLLVTRSRILAGTGFRTEPAAHRELERFLARPVVTLRLVDPMLYHLDTALVVLDEETIAYYPPAFAPESQELLRRLYPDAILADEADAMVLGLNAVSDGRHVVLPGEAARLAEQIADRGFEPIPVDISELRKAGGGPKCCTLEIRPASTAVDEAHGARGGDGGHHEE